MQRKTTNDISEIRTETNVKDSDSSSRSIHKDQIGRKIYFILRKSIVLMRL